MTSIALESTNRPGLFIRHRSFLGELTSVATDQDRQDATFELVEGLADKNFVSIRSRNLRNHVLRHQQFEIKLHDRTGAGDTQLLRDDSTFIVTPGLADPTAVSFRSFNRRDRFLRHRNFKLFVEPADSDLARLDATFRIVPGFLPHFTFDSAITAAQRTTLIDCHRAAIASIGACNRLNGGEKLGLLRAYDRAIQHGINTDPNANASAQVGGSRIDVNFQNLFPHGSVEISQTLIHEMMHCAGESHPIRRRPGTGQSCADPAPRPFDCPNDNGPYYSSPPLRAEFCIAGQQSDVLERLEQKAATEACDIDDQGLATLHPE